MCFDTDSTANPDSRREELGEFLEPQKNKPEQGCSDLSRLGELFATSVEHFIDFRKAQKSMLDHQYSMDILCAFLSLYIQAFTRAGFFWGGQLIKRQGRWH